MLLLLTAALLAAGGAAPTLAQMESPKVERAVLRKIANLQRRDAAAEAAAAASRGDFRLGGTQFTEPTPAGGWTPTGLDCTTWSREMVSRWNRVSLGGGLYSAHNAATYDFLLRYNLALIAHPAFPYRDLCAVEGSRPADRYDGPVRSFTEAARSGDPTRADALAAAGTADINALDPFGRTALMWAMLRRDVPMAETLLRHGADPNLRQTSRLSEDPAPLALALDRGANALADSMIARGARMEGSTGLCHVLLEVEEMIRHRRCSWGGLLAARRRFDLLERAAAAEQSRPTPPPSGTVTYFEDRRGGVGASDEIDAHFRETLDSGDSELARRYLPYIAPIWPSRQVADLLRSGHSGLAFEMVLLRRDELARSAAEAGVWEAAARARRGDVLAFLIDNGAELNLLGEAQLAACRRAAAEGNILHLGSCVRDAAQVRERLLTLIRSGDADALLAGARGAADLRGRGGAMLLRDVVELGTAEMVVRLHALTGGRPPDHGSWFGDRLSDEPRSTLADWPGAAALEARTRRGVDLLGPAVARGDVAVLAAVAQVEPLPRVLGRALSEISSGGPEGANEYDIDPNTERFANGPGPEALRMIGVLAEALMQRGGAAYLEPLAREAIAKGWNDVLALLLRTGFDPARAADPASLWSAWSGLGNPCKPSTGRMLIEAGLRTDYRLEPGVHRPPFWSVVVACKNPASVPLMVEAGLADVNTIDVHGQAALDWPQQGRRDAIRDVLLRLGARHAHELPGARAAAQRRAATAGMDPDFVYGED